ncbi:MAG: hypothetical protein IPP94_04255 [Ignavibacteria bacterium]|nr:hypothetical protein [Ignavibacteria bacterium]
MRHCVPALVLCAFLACTVSAQQRSTVYTSVISTGAFIVGAANSETGLFYQAGNGDTAWTHTGPMRIRANGFAVDERSRGRILYIAAGNGVHRSSDAGATWRVLTDWRVTEVLSIALDPRRPGRLVIGTAYGVFVSKDTGATWKPGNAGRKKPLFTSMVAADPHARDRYYCTAEDGLYRSDDGARTWKRTSLRATAVRSVAVHPGRAGMLAAGTENEGLHLSTDAGRSWTRCTAGIAHETFWAIAFDPSNPTRIYAGGHESGVYISRDFGASWVRSVKGLKVTTVHSLAVDPLDARVLYASTSWGGIFRSRDAGDSWEYAGLTDSQVVCVRMYAF